MQQAGIKDRRAKDMSWFRTQLDILIRRPREDNGYRRCVFRVPRVCAWKIPGGFTDALNRRLGYLRAINALRFVLAHVHSGPLTAIRLAG